MGVLSCSVPCNSFSCISFKQKASQTRYLHCPPVNFSPRITFSTPRKSHGQLSDVCKYVEHWVRSQKPCRMRRNTVVRSQFAEAGSQDASHSLTEFQIGSNVRGFCFYSVAAFVAMFLFPLMIVVHPFVLLFDRYRRKAQHLVAKIWATLAVYPFLKIEFEGLENMPSPDTPAVYVSNHQSFLDIYAILILGRSFKFISKVGIFVIPIIGWAMYLLGTIPLKRKSSRSQVDCIRRCRDLLSKGASVFFFPEGTRSRDGKMGVFKKGAFSLATKVGVPLVPITLMGTGQIMPRGLEHTLRPGMIKVVIHKPIEGSDPDVLCDKARNVIASALVPHV